jgi:hypothetical protein
MRDLSATLTPDFRQKLAELRARYEATHPGLTELTSASDAPAPPLASRENGASSQANEGKERPPSAETKSLAGDSSLFAAADSGSRNALRRMWVAERIRRSLASSSSRRSSTTNARKAGRGEENGKARVPGGGLPVFPTVLTPRPFRLRGFGGVY